MQEGDSIEWKSVNKICRGTAMGKHPLGWIVRLENGKVVIVHRKSIINYK